MANNKSVSLNDYDTKALDAKFEKMDRATMRKMTGTGMTPKKKAARKTTAKKKG